MTTPTNQTIRTLQDLARELETIPHPDEGGSNLHPTASLPRAFVVRHIRKMIESREHLQTLIENGSLPKFTGV